MSHSDSYGTHDAGAAEDISPRLNLVIWGYFLLFGLLLALLIGALEILFKFEVAREEYRKVGAVKSRELIELRQMEAQVLAGEKGLVQGKKQSSIEDATDRFLASVKRDAH